jgi:DNA polymerase-1
MFTWVNIVKAHARRNKYVETILGRRRYFPDITSSNWKLKGDAERATVNTVVQGSAADYLKQAMINMVDQGLASLGYQMVLQVHDELVFAPIRELTSEEIEKALAFIQYHMEHAIELRVPVIAQPKTVWTWGEAK